MSHTEDPYEVGAAMVSISICFLTKWSIVRMSMCFELFHECACAQRSVLYDIPIIIASIIDLSTPCWACIFGMCMVNAEIKRC